MKIKNRNKLKFKMTIKMKKLKAKVGLEKCGIAIINQKKKTIRKIKRLLNEQ